MTYGNSNQKTNGLINIQNNEQKSNMLHSNKPQPLNYRLLAWDGHIQNVAGIN